MSMLGPHGALDMARSFGSINILPLAGLQTFSNCIHILIPAA